MRIVHLANAHWEGGAKTGVPRFSHLFQMAFPSVVNAKPGSRIRPERDDVWVVDNHLAEYVPEGTRCVVVHHGCAQRHYDVDPGWRSANSARMCKLQKQMLGRRRTKFVAPSAWVKERFEEIDPRPRDVHVIPHWVPLIPGWPRMGDSRTRLRVTGDWRDWNKGSEAIKRLRQAPELSGIEFIQLDFPPADEAARAAAYCGADIYLCLSLSEGAPYSVADAEAAGMPIATTRVGYVYEFKHATIIDDRDDPKNVLGAMQLSVCRGPSFYSTWTLADWRDAWRGVLENW